jgi:hypothetical protein
MAKLSKILYNVLKKWENILFELHFLCEWKFSIAIALNIVGEKLLWFAVGGLYCISKQNMKTKYM